MFESRGLFNGSRTVQCATVRIATIRCNWQRHSIHFDPKFSCPERYDFSAYIISCYHLVCFFALSFALASIGKCVTARLLHSACGFTVISLMLLELNNLTFDWDY
jgi:hypothetical protein